ncbi:DUF6919 domain-containing protein [Streptomyces candidus]|uniref:DUF6919 domain-containing protein n=1 Tax=Streptomyces candidus TaxID=67283 RepID=A0A7X0HKW7_9ACTN|nr:hypothetical protein [Streptomyces candidus]MBB6439554.1 hypothetical protein [Streptomyces candidus]GHH54546.1 hypothetical protein GCM10018773_57670 [Streptomyces candidus]
MPRSAARAWSAARTLDDLGELTAQWLEGGLAALPGDAYRGGPDEETGLLVPVLAALNRAGIVTLGSQPGLQGPAFDGRQWCQRAAVDCLTDAAGAQRLLRTARDAELLHSVHQVRRSGPVPYIVVTTWGGQAHTAFGSRIRRRDIRRSYQGCHRDALRAVVDAHQVTLVDPQWGRDSLLWPRLTGQLTHLGR